MLSRLSTLKDTRVATTYVAMGSTRAVLTILLSLLIPQHEFGAVEIVQLDPLRVFAQQKLTQLDILMDDDTIDVSMQIRNALGHVPSRPQLVSR